MKTIPLWIRDLYVTIAPIGIYFDLKPVDSSESEAIDLATQDILDGQYYVYGNQLFPYLTQNLDPAINNKVITFVIPNLIDIYQQHSVKLTQEQQDLLRIAADTLVPVFKDIRDYTLLQELDQPKLQLTGVVHPFNVLHVPVAHLRSQVSLGLPITVELDSIGVQIELSYQPFDFYK